MILSPYAENGEVWLFEDGVVELDYDAHSIALCKMLPPLGSNATFKNISHRMRRTGETF